MVDFINISKLFGLEKSIAQECDTDKNGKLENDEISIFNQKMDNIKNYSKQMDKSKSIYTTARDATYYAAPADVQLMRLEDAKKAKQFQDEQLHHDKVCSVIEREAKKRGVNIKPELVEYWATISESIGKQYNVPEELLLSIVAQESNGKFNQHVNAPSGAGPMQITTISIKDFFPNKKNGWTNIYKQMNPKLLDDILYTTKNGKKVLKYKSPEELRKACGNDDELGLKVGLLVFEMKYVKAVAEKKYGKATYANIPKVITSLQKEEIKYSETENKKIVKEALENYNSVPKIKEKYAKNVIDSLTTSKFVFRNLKLIPKIKT